MDSKKAIIYDSTCPMCKIYTSAFVKNGLLTEQGRISFSELEATNACQIDFEKGRHEIPLIDLDGGQTIYGLDSMVYLLNQRFKIVGAAMKIKPVYWFFKKLYSLVSYNRRVIAPSKKQIIKYDCAPDFNLKYRLIYIVFALIMSFIIFNNAIQIIEPNATTKGILALVLITGFSGALFFNNKMVIEYLGQWATVLLVGSLVILPVLVFPFVTIPFFFLASIAMIWRFKLSFHNLSKSKIDMSLGTILYLVGSTMFIIIGLLHTMVHYNVLVNPLAQSKIKPSGTIKIGKEETSIWKLWQGMSLLFGLFMVFIGALNFASWYDLGATTPSSIVCIINMILLILVVYSGVHFFGKMQIYGGIFGLILFSIALLM